MKDIFTLLILSLSVCSLQAQDIINLNSGKQINAKVLEIKPDVITYKSFENLQGPLYSLYKNEVLSIQYENGYVEQITIVEAPKPKNIATDTINTAKQTPLTCRKGVVKQNNIIVRDNDVKQILKTNTQALELYTSGKKLEKVDKILANASLVIVGSVALLQLGGYVGTPVVIGACVYFGAAFTTATIFRSIGRSKVKKSVDLYNSGIKK